MTIHTMSMCWITSAIASHCSDVPAGLTKAILLKDGSQVKSTIRGENLVITIPPHQRDEADTVIKLER